MLKFCCQRCYRVSFWGVKIVAIVRRFLSVEAISACGATAGEGAEGRLIIIVPLLLIIYFTHAQTAVKFSYFLATTLSPTLSWHHLVHTNFCDIEKAE